jgi:hypothetical protein
VRLSNEATRPPISEPVEPPSVRTGAGHGAPSPSPRRARMVDPPDAKPPISSPPGPRRHPDGGRRLSSGRSSRVR